MAWKQKEPEMPFHEALDAAKTKLASQWLNTEPRFCAMSSDQGTYEIYPFDDRYFDQLLLMLFVDPTSTSGEYILKQLQIWLRRYDELPLKFMIVFQVTYASLSDRAFFERILRENGLRVHSYIDIDGGMAKAFNVSQFPEILISNPKNDNSRLSRRDRNGKDWLNDVEVMIQNELRSTDPGLPLFPPLTHPNFTIQSTTDVKPDSPAITLQGHMRAVDDYFLIEKQEGSLSLKGHAQNFFLIGGPYKKPDARIRVSVEVDDAPIFQQFAGEDIFYDENGMSCAYLREVRIYRLLKDFKKTSYQIKVTFAVNENVSLQLFGLRFS